MEQPPPLPPPLPQQPTLQSTLRQCVRCKGELHADAKVCPHCRVWQDSGEYAKGFCSIWVILMTICFLPVIAVFVVFLICAIVFLVTGGSVFLEFMEP